MVVSKVFHPIIRYIYFHFVFPGILKAFLLLTKNLISGEFIGNSEVEKIIALTLKLIGVLESIFILECVYSTLF